MEEYQGICHSSISVIAKHFQCRKRGEKLYPIWLMNVGEMLISDTS